MSERRDRIDWKWRIILGVIAVVMVAGLWWHHYINLPYTPNVPNPKMPSPNAFNYYLNAGRLVKDVDIIGWAISEKSMVKPSLSKGMPVPAGPMPAAEPTANGPGEMPAPPTYQPPQTTLATLVEKKALLKKNEESLALLREGLKYSYVNPPTRSYVDGVPNNYAFFNITYMLILESQVRESDGDFGGAMDSAIDCINVGVNIVRGGTLSHCDYSIQIQERGQRQCWHIIKRLNSQAARTALQRMTTIDREFVLYADILQQEKYAFQAGFAEEYSGSEWYTRLAHNFSVGENESNIKEKIRCYTTNRPKLMEVYSKAMDEIIADTRKPYASPSRLPAAAAQDFFYIFVGLGDYWRWQTVNTPGRFGWEYTCAMNRLLSLSLALRAYYLDHSSYPASLRALTPSYLSKLPKDPFALKGTFKYKSSGSDYTLYSLGPDCRDDGGKVVGKPGYREVQMYSKGDIVAGVNY